MLKRMAISAAVCTLAVSGNIRADQVFLDDVIIDGSECVGLDCANGENFGFGNGLLGRQLDGEVVADPAVGEDAAIAVENLAAGK